MEQSAASRNTWDRVLGTIRPKVSTHSFKTWFRPTQFREEDASSLTVSVPNVWFADWLRTHYLTMIHDALRSANRPGLLVRFHPESEDAPGPEAVAEEPVPETPGPLPWITTSLNPRYCFESFVVSSCNQFAHAAAMAVAEQPKRAYNPLYVYGGVGLGKTHLMQAIGNRVGQRREMRMVYTSAEHFMNELITAIRCERTIEFKERFRNVDLLLIDDVQYLVGKERTQEEFFHTFNALHEAGKQIVMTSDVPPRQIPTIEERLRSRFEWGLMADLQPPDVETKMAILAKKAEDEDAVLPGDVALFIASNSRNIRDLEGALIRVVAYASMAGQPITLELARQTLKDLIVTESPAATTEGIQKVVADHFNLKVSQLKARSNSHQITYPRQIAMYLCKQLTPCSLQEIGSRFGGKHHSTVIHAVTKIEQRKAADRELARLLDYFAESLR